MLNRFINLSQKLPIVYEFPPVFQCFPLFFIKSCTILERNEIKGNMGTNCVNEDSYDQAALNQINLSFYRTSSYNRNLCFFCLKPSKNGVILLTIITGTLKALEIVVKKEMDTR